MRGWLQEWGLIGGGALALVVALVVQRWRRMVKGRQLSRAERMDRLRMLGS